MLPATLITLAAIALLAPATPADVLEVDAFGGGDFLTVQEAIDAAQDGDIILVDGSSPQPAFTIDGKGVDVIADTPGVVSVFGGNIRIKNLAP